MYSKDEYFVELCALSERPASDNPNPPHELTDEKGDKETEIEEDIS